MLRIPRHIEGELKLSLALTLADDTWNRRNAQTRAIDHTLQSKMSTREASSIKELSREDGEAYDTQ